MMTEDNSEGNSLTLFFKKSVAMNALGFNKVESTVFDKLYMSIQTSSIGDTGEVVPIEQLNTQMQCDFKVGSYEMIGTFLRLLKNKISDGGIIVQGVFDEFLDALKSKEKRFTAAVECFETLPLRQEHYS